MSKGKLIAILVALAIIIAGFAIYRSGKAPGSEEGAVENGGSGALEGPAPSGSVDDAAAAILLDLEDDELGADIDAAAVAENDTALNEFGQSLDGSQF